MCGATRSDLVARLLKPEIDNKEIHDGVMWFLWKWMGGLAAWLPAPPLTLSPCTPSPGQPSTWAACLILPSVSVCVSDGCVAARHQSTEQAHLAALVCSSLGHISGMWPCPFDVPGSPSPMAPCVLGHCIPIGWLAGPSKLPCQLCWPPLCN